MDLGQLCCTELRATLFIGWSIDVQWSMYFYSFAPICIYATFNKHAKQQKNIENIYIYIYIAYKYVFNAQYMHIWSAYMHI